MFVRNYIAARDISLSSNPANSPRKISAPIWSRIGGAMLLVIVGATELCAQQTIWPEVGPTL